MDLANDARIKRLSDQIQQERDPEKLLQLSLELARLLDGEGNFKPPDAERS
jgi:hypothetical protein